MLVTCYRRSNEITFVVESFSINLSHNPSPAIVLRGTLEYSTYYAIYRGFDEYHNNAHVMHSELGEVMFSFKKLLIKNFIWLDMPYDRTCIFVSYAD